MGGYGLFVLYWYKCLLVVLAYDLSVSQYFMYVHIKVILDKF